VPIHLIAIGATEFYGPNRNGDGFKEATLRKYAHTFVTKPVTREGAYFYRDHLNKNPLKSYGTVKAAFYHPAMHRVELLVALNGTKEAAERNNGLLADRELEKLARDDDGDAFGVSMACRVPFDVCSGCGNRARHRGEYCTARTCKYGGLAEAITKVAADGHVLHADNPDPAFFDISHVYRPADRTAYVMGMLKAAGGVVLGHDHVDVGLLGQRLLHGLLRLLAPVRRLDRGHDLQGRVLVLLEARYEAVPEIP
jgi:hypothetical protein